TTPDQVIDALTSQALPNTRRFLQNHLDLARQYTAQLGRPIRTLAYEGGPLLIGTNQPFAQAFQDAARSPRIYDLYTALLRTANEVGLDLFTAFVYTD